jgi:Leucine Rich repeat
MLRGDSRLTDQSRPGARSLWSRVRFSIRGLIVLVLAIGCGLGWIVHDARVQRDAVAAIQSTGGQATYDWEDHDGITDTGLTHLRRLTAIEFLDLGRTRITDEGLVHLKRMKSLRRLILAGTQIEGQGLICGFGQH